MRFRKRLLTLLGAAAIAGLGVFVAPETAQADPMGTAPQGIKVQGNSYFDTPDQMGPSKISNGMTYDSVDGSKDRLPMDGVQLTHYGNHNEGGAIWSSQKSFNLRKDQTFTMWIYVSGDVNVGDPGEGMAFVLQNNSTNNQFSGTGESLGVWGVDPKSKSGGSDALAKTAIPNSWALEFDTEMNNVDPSTTWPAGLFAPTWDLNASQPSAFDLGKGAGYGNLNGGTPTQVIKGEHISSGYPDLSTNYEAKTYSGQKGSILTIGDYYYYKQNQYGLISDTDAHFLADQSWHHVTLKYTAPKDGGTVGQMYYLYDDRDPVTGAKKNSNSNASVDIDLGRLGATGSDSNVYWGLTGSTGDASTGTGTSGTEDSIAVFEHIPGQVNGSATAKMIDETNDDTEVNPDGTSGGSINGNDKVRLEYNVKYDSGEGDWKNIMAQLHVPNGLTIKSGTVTYKDGSQKNVDLTDLSQNKADQTLSTSIGNLNTTNGSATVTLNCKAENKNYSAPATTSNFVGNGTMASASINKFSIKQQAAILDLDQDKININQGSDVNISGKVSEADGSVLTNSKVKIIASLIDSSGKELAQPTFYLNDNNPATGFSFKLTSDDLTAIGAKAGQYKLVVTATDGKGNMTGAETVDITIIGTVDFGSSSGDLNYDATISGTGQLVSRSDPNWSFNINDTLADGTEWKLYAEATPLTLQSTTGANAPETNDTGTPLDGQLVYSDGTGIQPLTADAQTPITDHVSDGSNTPVNIASNWDDNSGILLQLNGGAVQGHYKGTVTWILSNAE